MFFSVMTKNLNWKISSKNLVTFKRWEGVNYKKNKYYGTSLKNPGFFGGFFSSFPVGTRAKHT